MSRLVATTEREVNEGLRPETAVRPLRWAWQRAGNWAFGIALLHPFLIYFPAFILTETLFITLLWAGLACLQKWDGPQMETRARWLYLSALALGLGCLTRPALQPFLVVA